MADAPRQEFRPKTFVDDAWGEHDRALQNRIAGFLLKAYGGLLVSTMLLFFLQGFGL